MEPSFADLGVATPLVDVLAERGIRSAFPVQVLTIADALAGRDVCGKAKTGSGKTLAFGLPTVQALTGTKPGVVAGLILVPTRELATQVLRRARSARARSGRSHRPRRLRRRDIDRADPRSARPGSTSSWPPPAA
jgi:superfamily II DNA/RNA helicase